MFVPYCFSAHMPAATGGDIAFGPTGSNTSSSDQLNQLILAQLSTLGQHFDSIENKIMSSVPYAGMVTGHLTPKAVSRLGCGFRPSTLASYSNSNWTFKAFNLPNSKGTKNSQPISISGDRKEAKHHGERQG